MASAWCRSLGILEECARSPLKDLRQNEPAVPPLEPLDIFPYRNMIDVPRAATTSDISTPSPNLAGETSWTSSRPASARSATSSSRWAWRSRQSPSTSACFATSAWWTCGATAARPSIAPTQRRSGRSTNGPPHSSATGAPADASKERAERNRRHEGA